MGGESCIPFAFGARERVLHFGALGVGADRLLGYDFFLSNEPRTLGKSSFRARYACMI
jgi:hypothetical protein